MVIPQVSSDALDFMDRVLDIFVETSVGYRLATASGIASSASESTEADVVPPRSWAS